MTCSSHKETREAYANTVLRSLHYAVPQTMGINFNSTRGRIHGLHPLMFNPGTENVGIALPIPQPNDVQLGVYRNLGNGNHINSCAP